MDALKNKHYVNYDYISRYTSVPVYFNTVDQKEVAGLGTNINTNAKYITHTLIATDTLDYLALKYYGDPTLWWAIAYFNNIQDAFDPLVPKFKTVRVPSMGSIAFKQVR